MSATWISRVHEACNEINYSARALAHWGEALDAVGLSKPADALFGIADAMARAEKEIKAACNEELSDALRNSQEGTAGLLKLALHGALRPVSRDAAMTAPQPAQSETPS